MQNSDVFHLYLSDSIVLTYCARQPQWLESVEQLYKILHPGPRGPLGSPGKPVSPTPASQLLQITGTKGNQLFKITLCILFRKNTKIVRTRFIFANLIRFYVLVYKMFLFPADHQIKIKQGHPMKKKLSNVSKTQKEKAVMSCFTY